VREAAVDIEVERRGLKKLTGREKGKEVLQKRTGSSKNRGTRKKVRGEEGRRG